jgi:hypothetical protein
MHSLEQIEEEVKQLPAAEQRALLAKLAGLVAVGNGSAEAAHQNRLTQFFAKWDANHSVSVGEKPTRASTYAGNSRLH